MDDDRAQEFTAWYEASAPRVVAALTVIAGSRETAAEAAAEAFLRACEAWERIRAMANPAGWTYTVALNVVRRRARRATREREVITRLAESWTAVVAEPRAIEVWMSVARLPHRTRCAVTLRYLADLEEHEIAEVLGVTRGTVATLLSRGRAQLARELCDAPEAADA